MPDTVSLRAVIADDVPIFFAQEADPDAIQMVAFTAEDPYDRTAFIAKWGEILADDATIKATILVDDQVAGNILCFALFGKLSIGYWLGRAYWGRGIATKALIALLAIVPTRPLYARVAKDNIASRRVLEHGGFQIYGEDKGFACGRQAEVEEWLLELR